MSPKEIWCNETQERYVLAIAPETAAAVQGHLRARALPVRGGRHGHRRPPADRSRTTGGESPVDMPMDVLLGKPPKMHRDVQPSQRDVQPLDVTGVEPATRPSIDVLRHPTVASKRFLITIGDRTVGGLSHRDQMVGPWQVPVADCAVTAGRLRRLRWRGDGDGRAHPAGARWMRRPPAAWRWPKPSPTCWPRRSSCRA